MTEIIGERLESLDNNPSLRKIMELPHISPSELEWINSTPAQEIAIQVHGGNFWMSRETFKKYFDSIGPQDDLLLKCEEAFGLSLENEEDLNKQQIFNRSLYRQEVEPKYFLSEDTSLHLLDIPKVKSCFDTRSGEGIRKASCFIEDVSMEGIEEDDEREEVEHRSKKTKT